MKRWTKHNQLRSALRQERIAQGLCATCGNPKPLEQKDCNACAKKKREACQRWYANKPTDYHNQRSKRYTKTDKFRANRRTYQKKKRQEFWKLIFEKYGEVCECCKESNKGFLTIDHVNGGGNKKDGRDKMGMLRRLAKGPKNPEFRILCFNCNCGRQRCNGVCPHKHEAINKK